MHKPGLPQLRVEDFPPQLIWLAITFAVLYVCLAFYVLPRIAEALKQRKAQIDGDVDKARAAQKKSEEEAARYEAELAAARTKAQQTLRAAREKLDAEFAGRRAQVDKDLAARTVEAQTRATAIREQASSEMETITADVVGDIVKQLVGIEVNDTEVRQALRQSTKE